MTTGRCHPSLPGVALRIIAPAQDPDADRATAAALIALDPALSARVLRLSNPALFANRRRENLQQAINKLGLHPTLQLALGFSLMTNLLGGSTPHAGHERMMPPQPDCRRRLPRPGWRPGSGKTR